MSLNTYPLWCRECGATYDDMNVEGICQKCDTPNLLGLHHVFIVVPVEAYSQDEAKARLAVIVNNLINEESLPTNSTVW